MSEVRVTFEFSGRYFHNDLPLADADKLLFAFHGQGHLAEYFLKKFHGLASKGVRVVVPEGLSHYYLDGDSGRVGASWMTSEDRIHHIENYLRFINEVYAKETSSASGKPLTALGFSQGAATVSRWVSQPQIEFNRLVLWAGLFPPDLDWNLSREVLKDKEVHFVYGLKDPYLTDERFREQGEIALKLGLEPLITSFNGGHNLDEQVLSDLFS